MLAVPQFISYPTILPNNLSGISYIRDFLSFYFFILFIFFVLFRYKALPGGQAGGRAGSAGAASGRPGSPLTPETPGAAATPGAAVCGVERRAGRGHVVLAVGGRGAGGGRRRGLGGRRRGAVGRDGAARRQLVRHHVVHRHHRHRCFLGATSSRNSVLSILFFYLKLISIII